MYKVNDNGIIREMTQEEEREFMEFPAPEPTPEERIKDLEEKNKHLEEALELLLSGVTADE